MIRVKEEEEEDTIGFGGWQTDLHSWAAETGIKSVNPNSKATLYIRFYKQWIRNNHNKRKN